MESFFGTLKQETYLGKWPLDTAEETKFAIFDWIDCEVLDAQQGGASHASPRLCHAYTAQRGSRAGSAEASRTRAPVDDGVLHGRDGRGRETGNAEQTPGVVNGKND